MIKHTNSIISHAFKKVKRKNRKNWDFPLKYSLFFLFFRLKSLTGAVGAFYNRVVKDAAKRKAEFVDILTSERRLLGFFLFIQLANLGFASQIVDSVYLFLNHGFFLI